MKLKKDSKSVIVELKCHECSIVYGALRYAASLAISDTESGSHFGCERGTIVELFNQFQAADAKMNEYNGG